MDNYRLKNQNETNGFFYSGSRNLLTVSHHSMHIIYVVEIKGTE